MIHSFDTDVAKKYGIPAAILLQHFAFWIAKNEANDQNYYDGNYWTYNSVKAFETLFPYLSTMQIRSALKKLVDEGLVITGNYNQMKYDRTLWYALTEKGKSICYNDKIHLLNLTNGSDENNKPIPDIKPYIDTDISKKERKPKSGYDVIVCEYTKNDELKEAIYEFIKMRKMIKKPMTDRALKGIFNKLDKFGRSDGEKIAILDQSIQNSWQGVYELKEPYQEPEQPQKKHKIDWDNLPF